MTLREIMLFALGRDADPNSRGRQIPGHYSSRKLGILSSSSPIATQIPHAVGAALTAKTLRQNAVALVYFGDGATSKGDFHESCNWAGVQKLPCIFFCQNNEYAISVPQRLQMAIQNVADRAAGYGFPGVVVDGNDFFAVHQAACEAVERARSGGGPTLVECKTMRMRGHAIHDNMAYVPRDLLEEWTRRDPVMRFEAALRERELLDDAQLAEIQARVAAEVDDAQRFAENSPYPDPAPLEVGVYAVS
jgi:TPP-dependent pyruvate/acetoin dehydrogenase alpha subunit